jgi:hypothetical protein
MIHAILEGGWRNSYPKGHNQKFIMIIMTSEGCVGHILLPHFDMMIAKAQVYFGEVDSAMNLIQ